MLSIFTSEGERSYMQVNKSLHDAFMLVSILNDGERIRMLHRHRIT
jgi:hypothetical protein